MTFILRDFQKECKGLMHRALPGKYGIALPTGAGKTVIFASFIASLNGSSNVLLVVNRDELVDQTAKKLEKLGVKFKIEKAEKSASVEAIRNLNRKLLGKWEVNTARAHKVDREIASLESFFLEVDEEIAEYKKRIDELQIKLAALPTNNEEEGELSVSELKEKISELENPRIFYTLRKKLKPSPEWDIKLEEIDAAIAEYQRKIKEQKDRKLKVKTETLDIKMLISQLRGKINTREEKKEKLKLKLEEKRKKSNDLYQRPVLEEEKQTSVVIASVQSLHNERRILWDPNLFTYAIFDEGHHLQSISWTAVDAHFKTEKSFAFSATLDCEKIGYKLLYKKELVEFIQAGWMARPEHLVYDLRERGVEENSEEHDQFLEQVIRENWKNEKIIVFCSSVDQVHRLGKRMEHGEVPVRAVSSRMRSDERRSAIEDFRQGRVRVLLNFLIVYEGFDDPSSTMIISKITPNLQIYTQASGRGFRTTETKKTVKIVDIVLKDEQIRLPSLFGLNRAWVFSGDAFDDALAARAYAKEKNLFLPLFQSWDQLRSGKIPIFYNVRKKPLLAFGKHRDGSVDNEFMLTRQWTARDRDPFTALSDFADHLQGVVEARTLSGPVIRRTAEEAGLKKKQEMDSITSLRAKAWDYLSRHHLRDSLISNLRRQILVEEEPLTSEQCRMAIDRGNQLDLRMRTTRRKTYG